MPTDASEEVLKNLQDKRNLRPIGFADEEPHPKPAPEEFLGESHMTLKDVNERRTAGRRITGALKNLGIYESLDAQTHPSSPKHRRMWSFFVVGFAAGIIGFVLLFFT
jgi:hypothetical protein